MVRNLEAVHDTYLAYLEADQNGAQALSAAAKTSLNKNWAGIDDSEVLAGVTGALRSLQFF